MLRLKLLPALLAIPIQCLAHPVANQPSAEFSKVQLELDLGRYRAAEKESLLLIKKLPESHMSYYYLGRSQHGLQKSKEAIRSYKQANKLKPNQPKIFNAHGLTLARLGKIQEAIIMFDKAIQLDKNNFKAYSNRGIAKGAIGDYKSAINDFDTSIRLNPRHANSYRNRGISKEAIKDLKGACADWKIAAALGQDDPNHWIKAQCKQK
jgi:tetratricopeptide (TPR) repeat protein